MKQFDNNFLNGKIKLIAGTDEAGRGPLAGPVVAAAVIFSPSISIEGVNDSKKLSFKIREELYDVILDNCLACGISVISAGKIDKINILNASLLAMHNSIRKMNIQPDLILADGNKIFNYDVPVRAIIKGDGKSFSIAAASIIAKVTRDRIMKRLSNHFPEYHWEKNKGYPTKEHIKIVQSIGPCQLHRKTFLKKILADQNEFNFTLQAD